jgi:predicted ATPase
MLTLNLDASQSKLSSLKVLHKLDLVKQKATLDKLRNIVYISAMREGTKDIFPSHESSHPIFADVGFEGQYAPWWFDEYADYDIDETRTNVNESALTLRRQLNAWANDIFPGSEANTNKIDSTPLVRLELRIGQQTAWMRPANIGYGLTYAFPILVAGLLIKKGQVLIVDSPEAHLHPMGQSKIGYFLGVIAASGVQVILETHSDHVLNGVRLAVAAKKVSPSDVAIHFFSPSMGGGSAAPVVISPQIDLNGSLSEWPDGFFDQTDKDLARLNGWE